ncbi:MAG: hypothetical protein Q9209_000548 [Squamulea sp. 1 TL-2023]
MSIAGHAKSSILLLFRLAGCPARTSSRWPKSRHIHTRNHFLWPAILQTAAVPRCARYSTASLIQESQSPSPVIDSLSSGLASLGNSSSTDQQNFDSSDVKPIIRQVNTTRIGKRKNARSQVEKLSIYQRDKAFRNQILKDRGSWSYDWRIPLGDLERYHVPDGNGAVVPASIPVPLERIHALHNIRVGQIPQPPTWTTSSFYAYVVRVTSSKVTRLVARQIYPNGESHTVAVANTLAHLFADPALKYVVSIEAGNVALRFLFDHGKFARAQDLFGQLQELQKDTDSSTYNIMLGAAAKQKDLHTFTYILKMMILHRVRPTGQTWLHLVRAVREDDVRMMIINRMDERDLLVDPATTKEAIALLMPQLVVKHLDSGRNVQELFGALDNRYGPEWCSTSAAESLINGVGVRHSTEEALVILKKLYDRGYRPTHGILLLLLRQCSWSKSHEAAVELLCLFRTEYNMKPSTQIYDVLFQQAWKGRLYNCCRVLWIHACIHGHTSFDMQRMVKKSLCVARSTLPADPSRSIIWEETAGKVIIGHGRQNSTTRFQSLMSLWKPIQIGRQVRDRFLRAARSILDGDLAAVGQYRIQEPLDELLRKALKVDRQWGLGRALRNIPIECKYSQLIDVDLIPNSNFGPKGHSLIGPSRQNDKAADSFGCCWMSDGMRSRPCICPCTIKQTKMKEQEATAEAVTSSFM